MIHKDFIMRQVQEFAKFLQEIMLLRQAAKFEPLVQQLEEAVPAFFKENLVDLKNKAYLKQVLENGELDEAYWELLSDYLTEYGYGLQGLGQTTAATDYFDAALYVLQKVEDRSTEMFSFPRLEKIKDLKVLLN